MINPSDFDRDTFRDLQVLVIGDAMIDRYYYGQIDRQSPEADVPIVDVKATDNRLGGAANVALNLALLGAKPHLMSVVGADEEASLMKSLLDEQGICHKLILADKPTTIKTRVYNQNHYVLRYDIEDRSAISAEHEHKLLQAIAGACKKLPLAALVLQDYNKGVLTPTAIQAIIRLARTNNIPVVVDPKADNFFAYQGVDLFKPNLKEINSALNLAITGADNIGLKAACATLRNQLAAKAVLVTLAQHGAVAQDESGFFEVDAHPRTVVDVSGAGDTVVAMATLLLALKFPLPKILYYSNLAGGLVIEQRGVQALDLDHWLRAVKPD